VHTNPIFSYKTGVVYRCGINASSSSNARSFRTHFWRFLSPIPYVQCSQ